MPRNMLSIRSVASARPRRSAKRRSNSSSAIRPVSSSPQLGERRRVLAKHAQHRVLGQALVPAEGREAVPDRGREHAAEVDQQPAVIRLPTHRIGGHGRRGYRPAEASKRWFAEHVRGAEPPLAFERISGGRSNLTYAVADGAGRRWALRRPPLGKRLASAHDMAREHRIISALQGTDVPVPPAVGLCEDESVNGAPFFVMDFVEGPILRSRTEAEESFDEAQRRAIGERVVDTLVAIHAIDPDRVGLGDLGRREDYVARQLRRWHGQWEKSKTHEVPLIDDVHRRLRGADPRAGPGDDRARRLPARQHDPQRGRRGRGGRRLGALHARRPARRRRHAARLLVRARRRADAAVRGADHRAPAFPSRDEVRDRYAERFGRDVSEHRLLRRAGLVEARRSSSRASTPATPPASTASPTRAYEQFAKIVERLAEAADEAERRLE